MQTFFSPAQLADPHIASSEAVIRKCVHCGFCTATCPTYVLLGDELDSPRGRISLIKDMLENERQPTKNMVKHIDRCLSCLSCMTTCPSGVNYMHLIDHARAYVEQRYERPWIERVYRAVLAKILPYPKRLRTAVGLAAFARPFAPLFRGALRPLGAMIALAPKHPPAPAIAAPQAQQSFARNVVLMQGCADTALRPGLRQSAIRVLAKAGIGVVASPGENCCGALVHHLGREEEARAQARRNIDAWIEAIDRDGIEAIVVTASGCGTMLKDYGFLFKEERAYAAKAARIAGLAKDITEVLMPADIKPAQPRRLRVAYHSACSMQHGQKITAKPAALLTAAGFTVVHPADGHLCCGSAGTYNILQPEIAGQLRARKVATLEATEPEMIAAGNLGCITQISQGTGIPVVHTVELLDWATGGPAPL